MLLASRITRQWFPSVHPQERANYTTGAWNVMMIKGVYFAMGREGNIAPALKQVRMHTLCMYHKSRFRKDTVF